MPVRLLFVLLAMVGLMACQPTAAPPPPPPTILLPTLAAVAVAPPPATATLPPVQATYTAVPAQGLGDRGLATEGQVVAEIIPSPPSPIPPPSLPAPYTGLSLAELRQRPYGGGELVIEATLQNYPTFTRYLIRYPSDGLTVYGFMNVPRDGEKFPVALVLHGYVPEATYRVQTYTTRFADTLAEAGYLVIHPNYRNFPPSDTGGPNLFRVDYAVDVLNLMAIIQVQSGDPTGVLRRAQGEQVFLWGHSMGGGIAQRVLSVRPAWVAAAVLYASMSGDERRNFEQIIVWSEGRTGEAELNAPAEVLTAVSPLSQVHMWQTPLQIHHGTADATTPLAWSEELCGLLGGRGVPLECFWYEGAGHNFTGTAEALLMERVIAFWAGVGE
jgi:uncharacterized protein